MKFKEIVYSLSSSPPIKFAAYGTDFSQFYNKNEKVALYIVAFDELFGELDKEPGRAELISILQALNQMLADPLIEVRFLEFMNHEDIDPCIPKIKKYLGEKNNNIVELLKEQKLLSANLLTFREDCKQEKIKTVLLGGIHGTACVWATAAKYAETVYARLLPDSNHPNLRYLTTKHLFLFENAIIVDSISEGHHATSSDKLFNQYLCFPVSRAYSVKSQHDYINNRIYRSNVENLQKEDKEAAGDYIVFISHSTCLNSTHMLMQKMADQPSKKIKKRKYDQLSLQPGSSSQSSSELKQLLPPSSIPPSQSPIGREMLLNQSPLQSQLSYQSSSEFKYSSALPIFFSSLQNFELEVSSSYPPAEDRPIRNIFFTSRK